MKTERAQSRPIAPAVLDALRVHWSCAMDEEALDIPLTHVDQFNEFGEAPIHIAAWRGSVAEVRWLLENGAKVDHCVVCELTPLHYAYMGENMENIRALLDAGADRSA